MGKKPASPLFSLKQRDAAERGLGLIHFKTVKELTTYSHLFMDSTYQDSALIPIHTFLLNKNYEPIVLFLNKEIDHLQELGALYEAYTLTKITRTKRTHSTSGDEAAPQPSKENKTSQSTAASANKNKPLPLLKRTDSTAYHGQADFFKKMQKIEARIKTSRYRKILSAQLTATAAPLQLHP